MFKPFLPMHFSHVLPENVRDVKTTVMCGRAEPLYIIITSLRVVHAKTGSPKHCVACFVPRPIAYYYY